MAKVLKQWGPWAYYEDGCLRSDGDQYEIPVAGFNRSAAVLDWIAQVAARTSVTDEDLGQLVRAIDDLVDLQATLCGEGQDRSLEDPVAHASAKIAFMEKAKLGP